MDQCQAEPVADSPSLYSSAFAQVIFVNMEKSYMMDTPVKCDYLLTSLINPNNRDWIGIFKVGWSTARDYHTFVWAPLPKGDQRQQQVTFEAYYLPKEDNDFYQFCYVTHKGEIRGASTPIGFRQPGTITVDVSDNQEMLVITTQEQIEEVEKEKAALELNNTTLTEENTVLKAKIEGFEKQVEHAKEAYSSALEKSKDDLKSMEKQVLEQKEKHEVENKILCEKADQLEKQLTQKKEEYLTAQKANQELQEKLESAQTTIEQSKQMYEKAMDKLEQVKQETEALKAEIAAYKTELGSVTNMKSQALSELEIAQSDLHILRKENQELTKHLQKAVKVEDQMGRSTEETCMPDTGKFPDRRKTEYENLRKKCKITDSDKEQLDNLCQILKFTEEELQVAKCREAQTAANLRASEVVRESSAAELCIARQDIQLWKNNFDKIQQNLSKNEIRFTEMEEDLQQKNSIVEIRTMEVSELSQEIERLTSKIDELKANSAPRGRIFHLEHPNPYGVPVPVTQPSQSGLHYGNPYTERDMPTGSAIPAEGMESVAEKEDQNSRKCPVCQILFPINMEDHKFEEHVQTHFHLECPMCHKIFIDAPQHEFNEHVENHFKV
ncbi:tax1-binding protein 1 [Callorhinchus milii]|uniref:tax1-binding protein 1 n=1 Tax=Callorhinchus milii TaxID=7868 RepID=UPI001C3FE51D|nr:tax1-binding protein 1 [Callorhinchus milii]